ncbi:dachshund homolog 2-like [Cololabis saira]|uniref:dachshund homolog 2-like n=1 Tax=Cololabis saira TaxID=129043 RepID=UPI002AD280CA|nr:dachshund homolog 2-like [Cololabis saira]
MESDSDRGQEESDTENTDTTDEEPVSESSSESLDVSSDSEEDETSRKLRIAKPSSCTKSSQTSELAGDQIEAEALTLIKRTGLERIVVPGNDPDRRSPDRQVWVHLEGRWDHNQNVGGASSQWGGAPPSSRPGRPPKRCSGAGIQESPRLLHPGLPGLLSPNLLSHTGLTAAAMAELQKLQKMKMMMSLQNGNESDNDDMHSNTGGSECSWDKERLTSPPAGAHGGGPGGGGGGVPALGGGAAGAGGPGRGPGLTAVNQQQLQQQQLLANRLDLPFMMMPHPLLPMGLPPASVAMAMSQMNHLNTIANMAAAAQQIHTHVHRAPVIKERVCDSPSLSPSVDDNNTPLQSQPSSSASSSPERLGLVSADADVALTNSAAPIKKMTKDKEESSLGQSLPPGFPAPFLFADGLSSVETLLTNIQGLLKVAVENARAQDKQIQAEKRELKMELYREREMRESLERQLNSELQSRASIQKRLKKEKKAKRKLQEALEFESKRRERVEDALKHSSSSSPSPEPLHAANNATINATINDAAAVEDKPELNGNQQDNGAIQESRPFLKTPMMF